MPNNNQPISALIISDDRELVDKLLHKNDLAHEFSARDSAQFVLDDPALLDDNALIILDADSAESADATVENILSLKRLDPSQVVILVGQQEQLATILKSSVQPLIYRAFTKPVSANQVFLSFGSAAALHNDLKEKEDSGIDISAVGAADNRTNVENLVSDKRAKPFVYIAIGLFAIALLGFLLSYGDDEEPVPTTAVETQEPDEIDSIPEEILVSASVQKINQLNQQAAEALLEGRVIAPNSNNALEYYDQVLAIDAYDSTAYEGRKEVANQLRTSYKELVSNAEFDRALKVINVLQRIEPLDLNNDKLRANLGKEIEAHVTELQTNGTSEEIASTTAVLAKMESEFSGSKPASQALQKEKKLVSLIDKSLNEKTLIPPKKNNAYALVSDALKNNTVSNANLDPRVKTLSSELLKLASAKLKENNLEEASKVAALVKRLNVNKKELAALTKNITAKQEEAKETISSTDSETADSAPENKELLTKPVEPKIIPPKIIARNPPRYPSKALNKELEGWVQISFSIDRKGRTHNIKILEANPAKIFNKAAERAVEKWRFSPARNEETGLAVESKEVVTKVQFRLE